ncbi:MAG: hypothetical protein QF535_03735 [Anaerolineales bacterium]|nr:hypothetical protein [Anaerolineales bacterium]
MKAETSLSDEPLFCNFLDPATGLETRCEVREVSSLSSPYSSDVEIDLGLWTGSSDTLSATTAYEVTLSR